MKSHSINPLLCVFLPLWIAVGQSGGTGKIAGVVEDPTSAPIVGASVTLLSLDRVLQIGSDSKGAFQFEHLTQGAYTIEVTLPGFVKKTIPINLQPDHLQETVSVVLNLGNMPDMEKCGRDFSISYENVGSTGSKLTGTLRDYFAHNPIHQAEIAVVSESSRQPPIIVRSDPTGRFSISLLAPGIYDIQISRKGYGSEEFRHVTIPRENNVLVESTLRKHKDMAICQ